MSKAMEARGMQGAGKGDAPLIEYTDWQGLLGVDGWTGANIPEGRYGLVPIPADAWMIEMNDGSWTAVTSDEEIGGGPV